MAVFKIGCGGLTWPRETPYEQILSEIAQAGYEGIPVGPRGGRTAAETLALLDQYGLKPAPGYLGASFWVKEEEPKILERARLLADFSREAGMTELYVAAQGFGAYTTRTGKTRNDVAGHVSPEDAMTDAEYKQFAKTLNQVGEITLEQGVRSCFHNHVGSTIETREEIDHLFSMIERDLVFQGPDIGHLAWAGTDPVEFCRDYAESIKSVHVKDINRDVLREGVESEWDYGTFSARGIFAELGEGMVDFPAMFEILDQVGYEGWIIVETDVTQKPTALESATISRDYLKSIGY
jgi:inosose dehydratase